jgi:acyl-CoA hydrolase
MTGASERVRETTLRFLAAPTDMNIYGKVHGGAVMKWMDEAGYVCAAGWCGYPCATVYVGGIRFHKPIQIGNVVEVHAQLIYTGRTSMHIAVDVRSGDPKARQFVPTTHCVIVFVALDENGVPLEVPEWVPQADDDKSLKAYAERLMEFEKQLEREMQPYLARTMKTEHQ